MHLVKNSLVLLVSASVLGPFVIVSAYAATVLASAVMLPGEDAFVGFGKSYENGAVSVLEKANCVTVDCLKCFTSARAKAL